MKCLTNRLKIILNQVISQNQTTFIPQCFITDNIILGYECLHKIRGKKKGKKELVVLKLDISKVYDRIKWRFLDGVMFQMRFSIK